MNRRELNRRNFAQGAACVTGALALGLSGPLFAQARKPEAGTEYQVLEKPVNVDVAAGKIEVIEFFWYSCPHCNAFEPALVNWIKKLPDDVVLKRVPVAFRENMVPEQRLFYTLEAMGRMDLHGLVFHTIHRERVPIQQPGPMSEWAEKQGLDKARFQEIFTSFAVTAKVRRALQLMDGYQLTGVPALGIQGRYYTDGDLARNMGRALEVADYLIAETRKTR